MCKVFDVNLLSREAAKLHEGGAIVKAAGDRGREARTREAATEAVSNLKSA